MPNVTNFIIGAKVPQNRLYSSLESSVDWLLTVILVPLRDTFVCGLRNTAAQRRLLSEDKTDADTIEITSTMEAVETEIQEMNSGRNAELVLSVQGKPCYRCSKEGHLPRACRFRDTVCRSCGKRDTSRLFVAPSPTIKGGRLQ